MQTTVNSTEQFPDAKRSARNFGILTALFILGLLIISNVVVKALLLLGLFVVGSQFVFHGATAVAEKLHGRQRSIFQIGVSLIVPALLAAFLLHDVSGFSVHNIAMYLFSPVYAVVLLILGYFSWGIGSQVNRTLPVRGFLIAAGFMFVICYMGKYGVDFGSDEEDFSDYADEESVAPPGLYFVQYLLYVFVAYVGLGIRVHKLWRAGQLSHPRRP